MEGVVRQLTCAIGCVRHIISTRDQDLTNSSVNLERVSFVGTAIGLEQNINQRVSDQIMHLTWSLPDRQQNVPLFALHGRILNE